ncbi:hypothetical protein AAFF_G00294210 [Aldrovandia affinis]|uniref:Uncharacterized protein n=1 Tax=Aldrovandia affinis TaxID=143900 RepID=A0AAD7RBP2_9TELE|nr:hypothetical protein AAFF_G00294210 [Aldrovandia affinis]
MSREAFGPVQNGFAVTCGHNVPQGQTTSLFIIVPLVFLKSEASQVTCEARMRNSPTSRIQTERTASVGAARY